MVSGQKMVRKIPGENLKKYVFIFFIYCLLQILALKTCSQNIYKNYNSK